MPFIKAGNNHEIQSRKAESERIEPLSPTLSSSCTTDPRETGTSNMSQDGTESSTESSSLYKLASSAVAIKGKHESSSDTTKHESALKETDKISREEGKVNEISHLQANEAESSRPSSRLKTSHDNMNDLQENNAELNQAKKQKTNSVSTFSGRTAAVQEGEIGGKKRPVKADQSKAQHDIFREIRMERKRKREMQRRSNVNRELDHMAELITRINPPELRNMLNNKYTDDNNHAPLNRLELIHVAVKTLERLHYQSEKDASKIYELTMELHSMKEMINHDKVS